MAGKKEHDTEELLQLIHRQQQVLNSLRKRSEESERIQAEIEEEAERADAWLKHRWRDLWDEEKKDFVVPETGWPTEYVRKPKEVAKAEEQRVDEAEEATPDTLMHRLLKDAQSRR